MTHIAKVSWEDIERLTRSLYNGIVQDDKFETDVIVGISRGGLIPATMLSHMLKCRMIPLIWSTRDHEHSDRITADWIRSLISQYSDIVIVDDICDSGKTFETLRDYLQAYQEAPLPDFQNVKYAALHYRHSATFNCLYGERVEDDRWLVYPYEIDNTDKK